ncbi:MAG: PhoH family protein [Candidatus Omnitrophica bacterium]|nr:PhoH family protein [Candidatus Omnitrophota bacterium]MDD5737130.1 PhoH family protein [Candidatus Omnitrophota bacterium]
MDKNFKLLSDEEARVLFGRHDENLKAIEREFDVKVTARGENLAIGGDARNVEKASRLFEQLLDIIRMGRAVHQHEILYAIKALHGSPDIDLHSIYLDKIDIMSKKLFVTPKTAGQKAYVDAIRQFDIVFGIGPAGTGKTYLAMAMAINALKLGHVSRIVLTRPAVEAGESLGFLPGDLEEKVSPYLRPLYDALYEMMDLDKVERFLGRGVIEVAPLAFMRGRTLNDSFIILDEAQNATAEQMKMFLTRLGFDSKTVITGDLTQSDLPGGRAVGLIQSQEVLKGIEGIKFTFFTGDDVVRHELVQEIIRAYERYGGK